MTIFPGHKGAGRVELRPRGAGCEPNHRFYNPGMEGLEAAQESCWLQLLGIDSHMRLAVWGSHI